MIKFLPYGVIYPFLSATHLYSFMKNLNNRAEKDSLKQEEQKSCSMAVPVVKES